MTAYEPSKPVVDEGRDKFEQFDVNPVKQVADEPVSTFSADVDTASYSFVRRQLNAGRLPQKDSVRVEEMINYFDYAWPAATSAKTPFKPTVVVSDSPWGKGRKLVHIGIKGYETLARRCAGRQPGAAARRERLDGFARQAAAGGAVDGAAAVEPETDRHRGHRGVRRRRGHGAGADAREGQAEDPRRAARTAPRRIHGRCRRHRARVPACARRISARAA